MAKKSKTARSPKKQKSKQKPKARSAPRAVKPVKKSSARSLPPRAKVKASDTWNLATLFNSDADWEAAFTQWSARIPEFAQYAGKLSESAATLAQCLQLDADIDRSGERLGVYAFLKTAEDQGNSDYQRMKGRYQHAATQASEASSFIRPEIMAIPADTMESFL